MMDSELNNSIKNCPICGGIIKFLIKRIDSFKYYYCLRCSLVFSNPLPSNIQIEELYKSFSFNILPPNKFIRRVKEIYLDVKKIDKDIKKFVSKKNPKLLDFGGGFGYYSYCFYKNKYDVTLMDVVNTVCTFAKEKFSDSFKVVNIELNGKEFANKEKFDIIFCNQVIEHIKEPILFLNKLNNYLKTNGIIIITTPNQRCMEFPFRPKWVKSYLQLITHKTFPIKEIFRFFKKPWACCNPPRHIYAFNKINLIITIEKAGFIPIRIFSESSINQYYSHKRYDVFQKKGIKNFLINLFSYLGIKFINFIDITNSFGGNLVAYARKKK